MGIYAYTLADGIHDTSKDFTESKLVDSNSDYKGNDRPLGIWSDGTTMWVTDSSDAEIYIYKMSDKSRDPFKDYDTKAAGNENPFGI